MMFIFLLCVAAVAVGVRGTGYIDDREYHYRYFGNVNGHFPDMKDQRAAVAFSTEVIIQPHGDTWTVKFDNPRYDKVNEEIDDADEHEYELKPINKALDYITKPFQVTFDRGLVKSYKVPVDEPEWSVNVKRGFLSIFNLDFNQEKAIHSKHDKDLHKPHPNANYYKVMEEGVTGECETTYLITVQPDNLTPYNNNVLNVTKMRNYHNCHKIPLWEYDNIPGYDCHDCSHEDKPESHHAGAQIFYGLRGDRHNYVLEYAASLGDIVFRPYREGVATVHTNRSLELVEDTERQANIHLDDNLVTHHSLIYHMPGRKEVNDAADLKKAHYLHDIYGYTASKETIELLYKELVHAYNDQESYIEKMKSEHIPAKFLELVKAVSTLDYHGLEELYKEHADVPLEGATPEQRQSRRFFVDLLIATGTNPAFVLSKKLILSKSLPERFVLYLIQKLPYQIKEPSNILLDQFFKICETKEVQESGNLHSSCYFAFTTLVWNTCVKGYREKGPIYVDKSRCSPKDAFKYYKLMVNGIKHEEAGKYTIAYLRAIANLGIKEVIDHLEPYLHDRQHSVYHRVSAVWSLHRVLHAHPELVTPLLFSIYKDMSEDYELRIAAFVLLTTTDLSLHHIEAFVRDLKNEENSQVENYIRSTFHYISQSNHPCHKKLADMIQKVKYMLGDYRESFGNSMNYYSAGYDSYHDYGGFTQLSWIASNTSYIPRSGYLRINDYIWGESIDSIGIGFHAHGLEKFFDTVFGPKGMLQGKSVLDLFRTRKGRDAEEVRKEAHDINEKLHIQTRNYEPIQGDIFFHVLGNNFAMIPFDEEKLITLLRGGNPDAPHSPEKFNELNEFESFVMPMDRVYVFPSEAGIPVVLDFKIPFFMHFKNNDVSADSEQGEVRLKVDSHLVVDNEDVLTLSVIMPYDHTHAGVGIHRRSMLSLPIKAEVAVNVVSPKLKFKWIPVTPQDLYHHHCDPFAFIEDYSNAVPVVLEDSYVPLHKEETLQKWEGNYFHDYLGLGLDVKAGYENIFNDRTSWYQFFRDNDFREKMYYFFANPHFNTYTFDVALTKADNDATDEVDAEWEYDFYGYQDPEPHLTEFLPDDILEDDVKPHRDIKVHTHVLKGEVTAKGSKERKVHGEIAYTHTPDFLYHKLNVFYDRTPFHKDETEHFKVCMLGSRNYPKHDFKDLVKLNTQNLDNSLNASLHINFGNKCQGDHKITLRVHHSRTEEQDRKDRERNKDTGEHNYYKDLYMSCKDDRKDGYYFYPDCIYYLEEVTKLLNHAWEIEYENIPQNWKKLAYKISQRIKHKYFDYLDEDSYAHNPENKVRIEANYSIDNSFVDVRVFKPYENSFYSKVYAPNTPDLSFSTFPAYDFTSLEQLIEYDDYPYCYSEYDLIRTYDNYEYLVPDPEMECFKVLSKDCSLHGHFTILEKKVHHFSKKTPKIYKIYLDKWRIDMVPDKDLTKLIVSVNGNEVPVTEGAYYFGRDQGQLIFYLRFNGVFHTLHSDKYGLIAHLGRAAIIKVSAFYRGKVCGLCADFNLEPNDDFRGPENCLYPDVSSMVYSYTIKEEGCNVPEVENACIP